MVVSIENSEFFTITYVCNTFIFVSDLRKQARHLENDIDVKLVAFSKLGVTYGSSNLSSETAPLINSDDMFDTMSMEIQQLLNKVFKKKKSVE